MKNLLKAGLIIAAATIAIFAACEKDSKPFVTGGNVQTFFNVARPAEETFTFPAEQGGFFTTTQKSSVFVPAYAFVKSSGQAVTGEISLGLFEIKTKGDMIRFNLPTMTTDLQVLESGGMVFFGATQAGELLQLKPGYGIEINQWTDNPVQDMRLFFETFPPTLGDSFNAWALLPDSLENTVLLTSSPDTVNLPGSGFLYAIDNLYTWINCDRFLDLPASQLTSVSAKLSDVFTPENTAVFLVFNDLNSVIRLWTMGELNIFQGENFPLDAKVTFLAVAVSDDGAYFFDNKTTTISAGMQVELMPKETSLEKILDTLDDLP